MKKVGMKRWLSMLLSIILFAGCIGVMTPATESKAEGESQSYTQIDSDGKLGGTGYLNASDGSRYYGGLTLLIPAIENVTTGGYEWNKDGWAVDVMVGDTKTSATVNYQESNGATSLNFFFYQETQCEAGTVIKILKGKYAPKRENTTCGIEFTKDYTYVWNGTALQLEHVLSLTGSTSEYGSYGGNGGLKFFLSEKIEAMSDCGWDNITWTIPLIVDGKEYSETVHFVYQNKDDGTTYLEFTIGNIASTVQSGTKLQIKKGTYLSSGKNHALTVNQDYTFERANGTWKRVVSVDVIFTGAVTSDSYHETYWEVAFAIPNKINALAGCEWNKDNWNIPVLVNGEEKVMNVNYGGDPSRFDFFTDALTGTPATGCTFKIPAGIYQSKGAMKYVITIAQDYIFVWDGSNWKYVVTPYEVSFKTENAGNWWNYTTDEPGGKAHILYVTEAIDDFNVEHFWNYNLWKISVKIGDETKQLRARYNPDSKGFDFVFDSQLENDTIVTVLAGVYGSEGNAPKVISIDRDYTFRVSGDYFRQDYYSIDNYRSGEENTYPDKTDYVFAGWYEDAEYTKAIGTDVKTGYAYAKFVPKAVAGVHFQKKANGDNTDVRMITTVDTLSYTNVGFQMVKTVSGKNYGKTVTSDTVYHSVKGGGETYTPQSVGGEAANFFMTAVLSVPNSTTDTTLKVTAFWTTLDGTKVLGETRTLTNDQLVTVEASGN